MLLLVQQRGALTETASAVSAAVRHAHLQHGVARAARAAQRQAEGKYEEKCRREDALSHELARERDHKALLVAGIREVKAHVAAVGYSRAALEQWRDRELTSYAHAADEMAVAADKALCLLSAHYSATSTSLESETRARRQYYSALQDIRGAVRVFCLAAPLDHPPTAAAAVTAAGPLVPFAASLAIARGVNSSSSDSGGGSIGLGGRDAFASPHSAAIAVQRALFASPASAFRPAAHAFDSPSASSSSAAGTGASLASHGFVADAVSAPATLTIVIPPAAVALGTQWYQQQHPFTLPFPLQASNLAASQPRSGPLSPAASSSSLSAPTPVSPRGRRASIAMRDAHRTPVSPIHNHGSVAAAAAALIAASAVPTASSACVVHVSLMEGLPEFDDAYASAFSTYSPRASGRAGIRAAASASAAAAASAGGAGVGGLDLARGGGGRDSWFVSPSPDAENVVVFGSALDQSERDFADAGGDLVSPSATALTALLDQLAPTATSSVSSTRVVGGVEVGTRFPFDGVFWPGSSQYQVYKAAIHRLVASLVDGVDVATLVHGPALAYSSKARAMFASGDVAGAGQISQFLAAVMTRISLRTALFQYAMSLSAKIVIADAVYDLLAPLPPVAEVLLHRADKARIARAAALRRVARDAKCSRARAIHTPSKTPTSSTRTPAGASAMKGAGARGIGAVLERSNEDEDGVFATSSSGPAAHAAVAASGVARSHQQGAERGGWLLWTWLRTPTTRTATSTPSKEAVKMPRVRKTATT